MFFWWPYAFIENIAKWCKYEITDKKKDEDFIIFSFNVLMQHMFSSSCYLIVIYIYACFKQRVSLIIVGDKFSGKKKFLNVF